MELGTTPLPALAGAFGQSSPFSQQQRLFTLRFDDSTLDDSLLPHRLHGSEQLSTCYLVELSCLCSDSHLELKKLIGVGVEIVIHGNDGNARAIAGIVTAASQLGADGGFARYGLSVEPALAALRLRRNSRVFQDRSVVDIVRLLLDEQYQHNAVFARHFRHRSELTCNYPLRSFCQQYRESDLDFIERLLREEGISYRFDFASDGTSVGLHTLVLFDRNDSLPTCPQSVIRFHRAAATEADDTITHWQARRHIHSGAHQIGSFDYKRVSNPYGTEHSAIDHGDDGNGLIASLEDYTPQSPYYGENESELARYALLRQQAGDLAGEQFQGEGVVRALTAGQRFTLEQHHAHDAEAAAEQQFIVLGQQFEARNNLPDGLDLHNNTLAVDDSERGEPVYRHRFSAVRNTVPIVPPWAHTTHAKPIARGPQSATVVGPSGHVIFTDHLGRIKIQFHWARSQDHDTARHGAGAQRDDFSSCWVRVLMPSAGAGFGHQFIPRIGQEVIVDFIDGDIDRPVVVRTLHNGRQTPPTFGNAGTLPANKALSGIKSREHDGNGHNELIFDDTREQLRATLATTHGTSQLHLGYLIHPRRDGKGIPRGEGLELRSDNAGAIRAAQGLLLTTEPQPAASGHQLDRSGAQAQLAAAQRLSQQLADSALHHRAEPATTSPLLTADPLADRQPHLLLSGQSGMALVTRQATALAAGADIVQIAQRDLHQSSGRRWLHNVGAAISLFVSGNTAKLKQAIKLIAGQGDLLIQAQSDDVELSARQSVQLSACTDKLIASAGSELLLQSGGGYIRVKGGNIDIHCPGILSMKAKRFVHEAGGSVSIDRPQMPNQDYGSITPIEPGILDVPIIGDMIDGLLDTAALVTSTLRSDGLTVQPLTGKVLSTPEVQDAKFGALVGFGGTVPNLAKASSSLANVITERRSIAEAFYRSQGFPEHRIESHLRGINFDQPVEIAPLKKGQVFSQHQAPGSAQGNYYSSPGTPASLLGISPKAVDSASNSIVDRTTLNYILDTDTPALKSTAAAINDTWSIPGQSIQTEGGGTQYMTTAKDLFLPIEEWK